MPDRKLRSRPVSPDELPAAQEEFFSRARLAQRWRCSEKAIVRAEQRLNLPAYRLLRGVTYRLSDILSVENQGLARAPKTFVGLRPHQKAELLRREREELSEAP